MFVKTQTAKNITAWPILTYYTVGKNFATKTANINVNYFYSFINIKAYKMKQWLF